MVNHPYSVYHITIFYQIIISTIKSVGLGEGSNKMETKLDYKLFNVINRKHVVALIDRKEYSYSRSVLDENGNFLLNEKGQVIKERWVMEAPSYMGVKGLVLCGILKYGETLEQWIEAENIRKKRVENSK